MKETILSLLRGILGDDVVVELSVPEIAEHGHYMTSVALKLAKTQGVSPMVVAEDLAQKLRAAAPSGFFEKVEVATPGFVNMWISRNAFAESFNRIVMDTHMGVPQASHGKTVMVEFTDPNPFKLFHIGHLMSNAIGEAFSRLYEALGAEVVRANYQGDVGLHVAKTIWAMMHVLKSTPKEEDSIEKKIIHLGNAYTVGSGAYEETDISGSISGGPTKEEMRREIEAINKHIYDRSDAKINELYDLGRGWSLEYFEAIYTRLGTKFAHYFFESQISEEGKALVLAHPEVFKESDGAIVFEGEPYGLHTRVFVNSRGLPTYEAKELGLNKKKFELYPLDLSVIVTGNEIVDYFRVLMKAMELVLPAVAERTRHSPHGMMRLPGGKMSSRTGNVVTADSLIAQTKEHLAKREGVGAGGHGVELSAAEQEAVDEIVAIGAIKYSILKQRPGQDIVFDFEKSLSLHGDSGPYLQYTYARLRSILRKAEEAKIKVVGGEIDAALLAEEVEQAVIRKIVEFPDVVHAAAVALTPNALAKHLYELAGLANRFYEGAPIMKEEDETRRAARLSLVAGAAAIIERGLHLLGIKAPERM